MDTFPLATDPLPKGKDGWLLFLDELPNASTAVQLAAYRLVLDREVGNHKIHDNCYIVSAGNREEDGCYVQEMPSALKSRMILLDMEVTLKDFINYAVEQDLDYRITSFLQFAPNKLNTFGINEAEDSYACPRTWEFASDIIKGKSNIDDFITREILNGTVSKPVTTEFVAFTKYFDKLPSYESIQDNPLTAKKVDVNSIGLVWATVGMLSANLPPKGAPEEVAVSHILNSLNYMEASGITEEYQILYVLNCKNKHLSAIISDEMEEWVDKIADMMF